jgi:hypothetical protein
MVLRRSLLHFTVRSTVGTYSVSGVKSLPPRILALGTVSGAPTE